MSKLVRMTVYKIESKLIEVTKMGDLEASYVPGVVWISAQGGGEFHAWQHRGSERPWIGDTYDITVADE